MLNRYRTLLLLMVMALGNERRDSLPAGKRCYPFVKFGVNIFFYVIRGHGSDWPITLLERMGRNVTDGRCRNRGKRGGGIVPASIYPVVMARNVGANAVGEIAGETSVSLCAF